jgi:hypothetical protein
LLCASLFVVSLDFLQGKNSDFALNLLLRRNALVLV